jgi:hypothetical protein
MLLILLVGCLNQGLTKTILPVVLVSRPTPIFLSTLQWRYHAFIWGGGQLNNLRAGHWKVTWNRQKIYFIIACLFLFPDCVIVHSAPLNVSFENSDNVVNIKIQGAESDTVKQFKTLKVSLTCVRWMDNLYKQVTYKAIS